MQERVRALPVGEPGPRGALVLPVVTRPAASSSRKTRATVPEAGPRSRANCRIGGNRAPGGNLPPAIRRENWS
ncbi:hypothetical protein BA062_15500 [Prauserella flavalba]|uniref:Uncharacterized protein n=1 Tax=Prauserella flavalba TaxID=1477506 RepID=A0A318M2H5_9PSEU|nr:hypothetical protein BA062_15500 [Prauserella flavalba]